MIALVARKINEEVEHNKSLDLSEYQSICPPTNNSVPISSSLISLALSVMTKQVSQFFNRKLPLRTTLQTSTHLTLPNNTPHHTTLHYTRHHYTTLHHTTPDTTTLHYTTLHYTTLHYTTLHYTTLHPTALHYTTLHYTTLHYTTLHYTTLHYTTPHYATLHYSTLQIILPFLSRPQELSQYLRGY